MLSGQYKTKTKVKDDEYYTTYESALEILTWFKDRFKDKIIICPCDTEISNIYKVLKENKENWNIKEIILSDISKQSCLDIDYTKYDLVITNPPFSLSTKFILKLVEDKVDFISWTSVGSGTCNYINKLYVAYIGRIGKHNIFIRPDGSIKLINCLLVSTFDNAYLQFPDNYDKIKHIDKPVEKTSLSDYNLYFTKTGINKNEEYIYLPISVIGDRWFNEHYEFIKSIHPKPGTGEFSRILAKKIK